MPIYEYRCEVCGVKEEKIQPLSAAVEHDCSACNAPTAMKRQISRTAFTLAGGGWYSSGYGGEGKKTQASNSAEPPAGADAGAAPAAETPSAGCATGCACHSPVVKKALEKA
jgi:putative FmdB family regulatory protein